MDFLRYLILLVVSVSNKWVYAFPLVVVALTHVDVLLCGRHLVRRELLGHVVVLKWGSRYFVTTSSTSQIVIILWFRNVFRQVRYPSVRPNDTYRVLVRCIGCSAGVHHWIDHFHRFDSWVLIVESLRSNCVLNLNLNRQALSNSHWSHFVFDSHFIFNFFHFPFLQFLILFISFFVNLLLKLSSDWLFFLFAL